jgi:phosphatidate cytidylyltransferase
VALGLGAALVCAALDRVDVAGVVLGGIVAAAAASYRRRRGPVLAAALAYMGVACLALLWLRDRPEVGLGLTVWLLAAIWATDTGALGFGKWIGGAKLAPAFSPNKTWAGLLGGMACAAVASAAMALALPAIGVALWWSSWSGMAAAGAALALISQGGDLLESWYKRYFGVKDTSRIIPGHGGLLDRVDGLMAGGLALALAVYAV